jgi:hypothetical protein
MQNLWRTVKEENKEIYLTVIGWRIATEITKRDHSMN